MRFAVLKRLGCETHALTRIAASGGPAWPPPRRSAVVRWAGVGGGWAAARRAGGGSPPQPSRVSPPSRRPPPQGPPQGPRVFRPPSRGRGGGPCPERRVHRRGDDPAPDPALAWARAPARPALRVCVRYSGCVASRGVEVACACDRPSAGHPQPACGQIASYPPVLCSPVTVL